MANGEDQSTKGTDQEDSYGALRVAILALSDRGFFERLLESPEEAAREKADQLGLTDEDIEQVVEMIEESRRGRDMDELLRLWDEHEREGISIWVRPVDIWIRLC